MRRLYFAAATGALLIVATTAHAIPDHLQCYKIKDDAAKAAYAATLTPTDGTLGATPGCTVKVPAKLLCVDTTKSAVVPAPPGAPDGPPAQTYLCYKVKCPKLQPTWSGEDQFGTHNVRVIKTDLLCAPVAPVTVSTTTTLPAAECTTAGDCPGSDTECQARTCTGNVCGFDFQPFGQPAPSQEVSGDCQQAVCDGAGNVTSTADDSDGPNDANSCTNDGCVAGTPTFVAEPENTSCSELGGQVCDGSGTCVQCNDPTQCPGSDTECQSRSCTANECGFDYAANGTVVSVQTSGDCQVLTCDGAGSVVSAEDNADVPDDGNQCTADTCVAGTPSHPPVPNGTPCLQNGGTVCTDGVCEP